MMIHQSAIDATDYFKSIFKNQGVKERDDGFLISIDSSDEEFIVENISYYLTENGIKFSITKTMGFTWLTDHRNVQAIVYNPDNKVVLVTSYVDTRSKGN